MRTARRFVSGRHFSFLALAGLSAVMASQQLGCSGALDGQEPGAAESGKSGAVGLSLTLPGGELLSNVAWTITGPNGFSESNVVNLQNSTVVSFTVGSLPPGSGYVISLSGTTVDGTTTCAGTGTFAITAFATTNVTVLFQCTTQPVGSGAAAFGTLPYYCAIATAAAASPSETTLGNAVALSASASAPNASGITYSWSASSGTFSAPTAASTSFTCTTQGLFTITVAVADGVVPDGGSCPSTSQLTVQVQCDLAADAGSDAAAATDSAVTEAGPSEASASDASMADASASDAGVTDATTADASAADATTADASAADATTADASGSADAQASAEAGADAGSADAAAPSNLAVYRVGAGDAGLLSSGAPVFIDEYTPAGVLVQSIPLPTAPAGGNFPLISSGTATSEGLITLSANRQYLLVTGYGQTFGVVDAGAISGTGSAVPRVVGRVDAFGNVNVTTAPSNFATSNNPRSAASPDGVNLYVAGGAGGLLYTTLGSTAAATELNTVDTNLQQLNIFGSQLYVSAKSGNTRVATVGAGLPETAGQTITNLPGVSSEAGAPFGFYFTTLTVGGTALDTLYVADTGTGVTKYSLQGNGTWTASGSVFTTGDSYTGLTGVTGGTTVTLYATKDNGSGASGGGNLVSIVDSSGFGQTLSATGTVIATAAPDTAFRGVAIFP
jgi:hypothetical protein